MVLPIPDDLSAGIMCAIVLVQEVLSGHACCPRPEPNGAAHVKTQLRQVAESLVASQHAVAFTGAGISTASGIPDFRSPGTGLWNFVDSLRVASIGAFWDDPISFYRWIRPLAHRMATATPNMAHRALADLEAAGVLHAVITQNVDCLHQRAGSRRVLEIHGDILTMLCLRCHVREPSEAYWPRFLADGTLPRCPCCNAVLKPGAVLFGELPPHKVLSEAQQEALRCDLMLIAGSSLEVMPAADLPRLARRRGAALIIINSEPTPLDRQATLVLRANVTTVLPRLVDMCGELACNGAPEAVEPSAPAG